MLIHSILFNRPALEALEGIPEHPPDVLFAHLHGLGFNITISSELSSAGLAFRDGVVGVIVGQFENGAPALLALKCKL